MSTTLDEARPTTAVRYGPDPEGLAGSLLSSGGLGAVGAVLERLSGAGRKAVAEEVARALVAAASIDVIDVLAAGWRTHRKLREAARRTLDAPGTEELVVVATHRVTSTHEPSVDVLVDGKRIGSLACEVRFELAVDGLVGRVAGGRLLDIRSGRCTVSGRLRVAGSTVVERPRTFELPLLDRFEEGIPLLAEARLR